MAVLSVSMFTLILLRHPERCSQVSDKKYRINTRWLKKHSPRLANIIKACPDPRDELHPLNVPDVTTAQFEALLDFIDDRLDVFLPVRIETSN